MAGRVEAFKTARAPAITFRTIGQAETWPKAESNKCCIFEAVNIIGQARFGDEWTCNELRSLIWTDSPKYAEDRYLRAQAVASRPMSPIGADKGYRRGEVFIQSKDYGHHVAAWTKLRLATARLTAVEQEQRNWEHNQAAFNRLKTVVAWLAQQCRDGSLVSYYRLQHGGALTAMEASDWNVDFPLHDFVAAGGYERWFLNVTPAAKSPVFLFFDRLEVGQAVTIFGHHPAQVQAVDLGRLSPYLQMAVKLALKRGYTSEAACETKQIREILVEEAWADALPDVPMSKLGVETIAWVMGFPNPAAIERGKLGAAKRKSGSPAGG